MAQLPRPSKLTSRCDRHTACDPKRSLAKHHMMMGHFIYAEHSFQMHVVAGSAYSISDASRRSLLAKETPPQDASSNSNPKPGEQRMSPDSRKKPAFHSVTDVLNVKVRTKSPYAKFGAFIPNFRSSAFKSSGTKSSIPVGRTVCPGSTLMP